MAQPRKHLRNAPIEEAIIDFRVRPRGELQLSDLASLKDELASQYPSAQELREAQFMVGMQDGREVSSQAQRQHGWLLRSADNHHAVRLCLDNFSFSELRPYTTWEAVIGQALPLWTRYADKTAPQEVTRIGVRYINKLDLPFAPLTQYMTASPAIPAFRPMHILQFLTRVLVQDSASGCQATITQATGVAPPQNQLSLLLDIDAFREGPWPVTEIAAGQFEPLRELKNELFFSLLQEAVVSKYE